MLDRFNEMVNSLIDHEALKRTVGNFGENEKGFLLQTAATLILAEEIHKLSTSNVSLAQAQTDLATALTNLAAVITQAVTDLSSDNPATVQAAANNIEAAAGQINTLAGQLSTADPQPVSVPANSPAAVGVAAKS